MDYDRSSLAENYDRARSYPSALIARWMQIVSDELVGAGPRTIVDLGCGTGTFAGPLAERFEAEVVACDPSAKMLAQARIKAAASRVRFVRASAEALPLPDTSIDLVFISMALHHFLDPAHAAQECRRVLRPGGLVLLRTPTRELVDGVPYMPFFPGARALFEQRMPPREQIRAWFARAGFFAQQRTVPSEIAPSFQDYAERCAQRGDSILVSLPSDEFAAGMAALRDHAAGQDERALIDGIDLFVMRTEGDA